VPAEVEGGIGWGAINHFLMITKSSGPEIPPDLIPRPLN
jgi:hypothetical protein